MRATRCVPIALSLLAGCVGDQDGDGLSDRHELLLGTRPEHPDSDLDGLEDRDELEVFGTDPLVADTDADGFEDGYEVQWGANPLDWTRHPWGHGEHGWPDNSHRVGPVGSWGFDLGDQAEDVTGPDQFGETLRLHQFWGKVVVIDVSAGWCGPSRELAAVSEAVYQEHGGEDFVLIHAMMDDNQIGQGITDPHFVADYAEQYELTHPVIGLDTEGWRTLAVSELYEGGVPFVLLLDRDLVVVDAVTHQDALTQLDERIRRLLGRE